MVTQQDDPIQSSLNFCRLILLYLKGFECTDVERSLDYAYFLNKMESPVGMYFLIEVTISLEFFRFECISE